MNEAFEELPENEKALSAAVELFSSRPFGDIVLHEEIEDAFGAYRGTSRHTHLMKRLVLRLEDEMQRTLENVRGVGYKLPIPIDQVKLAQRRVRLSHNDTKKALKTAILAPVDGGGIHYQQTRASTVNEIEDMDAYVDATRKRMSVIYRKREGPPQWDPENA